jgi:Flp pilus assembly protein TadG
MLAFVHSWIAKSRDSINARSSIRQVSKDERGSIIVLAAFLLPVLMLVIGMGIDYSNATRVKATVSSALDASLLAAARDLSLGSIEERDVDQTVNDYFAANLFGSNLRSVNVGRVTTSVDETEGTVSGRVGADVATAFAGILQTNEITVNTDGQATYNLLNVELALVLDTTGSMSGQKLRDMKDAARQLIDVMLPDNGNSGGIDKVRISIVPYADLVNVAGYTREITGYQGSESCVYERSGVLAASDTGPVGPVSGFPIDDDNGQVDTPPGGSGNRTEKTLVNDPRNFRGYRCNAVRSLQPLTSNKGQLNATISGLNAGGWTAGHIGIQWGWYMLSPNFGVWSGDARPNAFGDDQNLKVLVVMTDGSFNTWYEDGQGNSFNQGRALCNAIKDQDIELYTVAFRAPSDAESFLRGCATGPSYYFETNTGTALRAAFEAIAQRLRELRLSS